MNVTIPAGKLKHRITLQRMVETRDAHGGVVFTPQNITNVWASIEPLRGRELFEANQTGEVIDGRIRIRYYNGLDPTWRILYKGRQLEIVSLRNVAEADIVHEILYRESI